VLSPTVKDLTLHGKHVPYTFTVAACHAQLLEVLAPIAYVVLNPVVEIHSHNQEHDTEDGTPDLELLHPEKTMKHNLYLILKTDPAVNQIADNTFTTTMGDFKVGVNTGVWCTFCTVNTDTKTNFEITHCIFNFGISCSLSFL
jgi:hypothetical protein